MTLKSGELTILDLNYELERRLKSKATPVEIKRLDDLKQKRIAQIAYNRKQGAEKRKLNKILQNEFDTLTKLQIKNRISEINNLPKYDLKVIDNEINRLLKKDFHFIVQDGFNREAYKISVSTLMKQKNPALFLLERFGNKVKFYLEQEEKKGGLLTGSFRGMQKLVSKIDENIRLLNIGQDEYDDENEELDETNPPILVDFIGEIIEINV